MKENDNKQAIGDPSRRAVSLFNRNLVVVRISRLNLGKTTGSGLRRVTRMPRMLLWAFWLEGAETKKMLQTFVRKGKSQVLVSTASDTPTDEELKEAMAQLKELPKFLPFFVFITVPIPGMTEGYVLLAFTLEKWLGRRFSLLPDQFQKVFQKKEQVETEEGGHDNTESE